MNYNKRIFTFWLLISVITNTCAALTLDKSIIQHQHEGVTFYLSLPKNKGEIIKPKGLIVNPPILSELEKHQDMVKKRIEHSHGIGNPHLQGCLKKGYAILFWITPAQQKDIKAEGAIDDAYGINSGDLNADLKLLRDKRWGPWLPKIDAGLEFLIDKYDLPSNGYLASTICLSTERLCRYIEYKPERFSTHLGERPIGLYASDHSTKHIYTLLMHRKNSENDDHDFYTGMRRFAYECYRNSAPCSILHFKSKKEDGKKMPTAGKQFLDYCIKLRQQMGLTGTLSEEEILAFSDRVRRDLADATFSYDSLNLVASYTPEEKLFGYEGFITNTPAEITDSISEKVFSINTITK